MQRKNLGLHIISFPSGSWGFVGNVPASLALEQLDGSTPTEKQIENAKIAGARIAGLTTRSWPTKEAAEQALENYKQEN
jgi:hypothetical protein